MKIKFLPTVFLALIVVVTLSCSKDSQKEMDQQLIEDYIQEHNLQAESTASGLYYVIEEPGTGGHPTPQDVVDIAYVGKLLNGDVFDSNTSATFYLNTLIAGWQEGIPLFGRGGKGILLVPSHLGYGSQSRSGIPANSVLIFDITLIDF